MVVAPGLNCNNMFTLTEMLKMKPKLLLIALIALILLAIMPVNAQTITMANPDGFGERDIIAYFANGSIAGLYNTASIITIDPGQSYIFTLKPQVSSPLDDPGVWLNSLMAYVQTHATALLFIAVLLGIVFTRKW